MRKIIVLAILSLLFLTGCNMNQSLLQTRLFSEEGIYTLDNFYDSPGLYTLEGNWEWFNEWEQTESSAFHFREVPGYWRLDQQNDNKNGTYRFTLKGLKPGLTIGFLVPEIYTNYRLYINNHLSIDNGSNDPAEKPGTLAPRLCYYTPESDSLSIVIRIHNHLERFTGFREAFIIGPQAFITREMQKRRLIDIFMISILLSFSIFHIIMYTRRKSEWGNLLFGIFCFAIALRTGLMGTRILRLAFPFLPYRFFFNLEFITIYMASPAFFFYLGKITNRKSPDWFNYFLFGMVGIYLILTFILPVSLLGVYLPGFLLTMLVQAFFIFTWLFNRKKRFENRQLLLLAFLLTFSAFLNDLLYDLEIINTAYIVPYSLIGFVMIQSYILADNYSKAFKKIEALANSYSRFVPLEFLKLLKKESITNVVLGDQVELNLAILFCDIRSFTTLSEKLSPIENFNFLNSYLELLAPEIRKNNGFIDKYIGDEVMALFPGGADDAVSASLDIVRALDKFNQKRNNRGEENVNIGIGIHSGLMMLGTVGEHHRMEGTVISDSVNLASRLEGLTKRYGGNIIISSQLLQQLHRTDTINYRYLGKTRVKGKAQTTSLYEIISDRKSLKIELKAEFEKGLSLFFAEKFSEAVFVFQNIMKRNPDDDAAALYLKQAKQFLENAPYPGWEGLVLGNNGD